MTYDVFSLSNFLSTATLLALSFPGAGQSSCGMPGVTVSVSPENAAPGQTIQVTLTNNSTETIHLSSSCVYGGVYADGTCTGNPVFAPTCLAIVVPIAPGGSHATTWNQRDDANQQVPSGTYSFRVSYSDASFGASFSCCSAFTVSPCTSTTSVSTRNGSGVNPQILSNATMPVLGAPWQIELDCSAHAPDLAVLLIFDTPVNGVIITAGEVLIGGQPHIVLHNLHTQSTVVFQQPIPNSLALCGLFSTAQGVCFGQPGPQLSNAVDLVLGT